MLLFPCFKLSNLDAISNKSRPRKDHSLSQDKFARTVKISYRETIKCIECVDFFIYRKVILKRTYSCQVYSVSISYLTTSFVPFFSLSSSRRFPSSPVTLSISCAVALNLAPPPEINLENSNFYFYLLS